MKNKTQTPLEQARKAAGFETASDFARHYELPESTYRSHENGTRGLTIPSAKRYAKLLGIEWTELLPESAGAAPAPVTAPREAQRVVSRSLVRTDDLLPVCGTAEGGPDGLVEWSGDVIDRIPRPAFLSDAKDAYAVYQVGTSMEPRYFQGELHFVNPSKPLTPDCFVVVQFYRDSPTPAAWVKQFVRKDAKQVILRQFNPKKELRLPIDRIRSIHKIVGSWNA